MEGFQDAEGSSWNQQNIIFKSIESFIAQKVL